MEQYEHLVKIEYIAHDSPIYKFVGEEWYFSETPFVGSLDKHQSSLIYILVRKDDMRVQVIVSNRALRNKRWLSQYIKSRSEEKFNILKNEQN